MPDAIRVGDLIEYRDRQWTVEALGWPQAVLRSRTGSDVEAVSIAALLRDRRVDLPAVPELRWPTKPAFDDTAVLLDGLSPEDRTQVEEMASVFQRVVAGTATMQEAADELGMGLSTAYRKCARYRSDGAAGLIDMRRRTSRYPLSCLDPRLVEELYSLRAAEVEQSTTSRKQFIRRLKARLAARYGELYKGYVSPELRERPALGEEPPLYFPSDPTMYRVLATVLDDVTFGEAATRRTNEPISESRLRTRTPVRPGELVQVDATTLDVLVQPDNPTEAPYRPTLLMAVDVTTRSILAWQIVGGVHDSDDDAVGPRKPKRRLMKPTSDDVALFFYDLVTPVCARPGWDYAVRWRAAAAGLDHVATADEWGQSVDQFPVVRPETVVIDNEAIFVSEIAQAQLGRMRVDVARARKARATDKAIVERAFHTVRTRFSEALPGYVGRSPGHRGVRPDLKPGLYTADEVQVLFTWWVMAVYQQLPVSGLRPPGVTAGPDYSPAQMVAHATAFTGMIPLPEELGPERMDLLPRSYVRCERRGFCVGGRYYDGEVLDGFRHGYPGVAEGLHPIHFDPRDVTGVFWRHPNTQRYHRLTTALVGIETPGMGERSPLAEPAVAEGVEECFQNAVDSLTNSDLLHDQAAARIATRDHRPRRLARSEREAMAEKPGDPADEPSAVGEPQHEPAEPVPFYEPLEAV